MCVDIEIAGCDEPPFGLRLGADHEILPDGEWIRWARRVVGRPHLFLYRHRHHKTFVLCEWVDRANGTCVELNAVAAHPGEYPGQMPREWLIQRCRPAAVQLQELREQTLKKRLEQRQETLEEEGAKKEVAERFRRKGKHDIAAMLMSANTPYSSGKRKGSRVKEIAAEMKKAARNPVHVSMKGPE